MSLNRAVHALLNTFTDCVLTAAPKQVYGVYVYGSCAYNAFEKMNSDIEVVVLVNGPLSRAQIETLAMAHRELCNKNELATRLDGQFIQKSDVGKPPNQMQPYPWFRDGEFHDAGVGDINSVTWWTLKHDGITVFGPDIRDLDISIRWDDVLRTMDYNLNIYWSNRARRLHTLVRDIDFCDAVLTICRIIHTIQLGRITPKIQAGEWAVRIFPSKWKPLIEDALMIRRTGQKSTGVQKLKRAFGTRKLIRWAVNEHAENSLIQSHQV